MLIATSLLLPLLVAVLIGASGLLATQRRDPTRRALTLLAPLTVLPSVLLAVPGPGAHSDVPWLLLGTSLEVDDLARPLLLLTALLHGAALMAVAWLKVRDTAPGVGVLSAFLLACFVGNAIAVLAADTVTFYLGFVLVSFAAAGLVVHRRDGPARRATGIYLVMSVLSETAILAALLLVVNAGGMRVADAPAAVAVSDHAGLTIALLLLGFGVKAGTVPLHVWLPLAHPAAPPAASAVLSGVLVKAGLVGWLRFLPLGETGDVVVAAGWVLLALSLTGAFLAVAVGVLQDDPKVVLAYSTISQMGFLGCVVAVGLLEPALAPMTGAAAVLYAVHHGLAKGALFLGVPVAQHYSGGRTGVVVLVGMVGAGLAVAGAPWSSGGIGKYVSKEAVADLTVLGVGLGEILPFVATGSTLLLVRFGWVLWRSDRPGGRRIDGELVSWSVVVVTGIAVPWWIGVRWTDLGLPDWGVQTIWDATWPILLGATLAGAVVLARRTGRLRWWAEHADGSVVAPGDLVVGEEAAVARAQRSGARVLTRVHDVTSGVTSGWSDRWTGWADAVRTITARLESRVTSWQASGTAFLLVLALAAGFVLLTNGWR